eukprot:5784972-Prymnesium_polylepis.1
MPDRTLCVLPWSCLESLDPVRARVFGRKVFWTQECAPQMCPALGFTRMRTRLRRNGKDHSPPPSSKEVNVRERLLGGPRSGE